MKHVGPLAVAGRDRPEGLESVDRPFDFVAPTIDLTVEGSRSATSVAAALAVARWSLGGAAMSAGQLRWAGPGSRCMVVSPTRGGIHAHHAPVDPALSVRIGLDCLQDSLPRAVCRPPAMAVMHRFPTPEPCWRIPPRQTRPLTEQDPVDHSAVALPSPASA